MSEEAYEDLTTQGTHRGDTSNAEENEVTVRGQEPPAQADASADASDQSTEAPERTFRLSRNEEEGTYRARAWSPDAIDDSAEGYAEQGRYETQAEMTEALSDLPDGPRFVVLENTETGEVRLDREGALSDDWTENGRFDQFTLFDDEAKADAYAEHQQNAGGDA